MKSSLTGAALAVFLVLSSASAFAAVGKATDVIGTVSVTRGGSTSALKAGDGIEQGDKLAAAEKSSVKVVFEDKTEITMVGGTLVVDTYVYDPKKAAENKSVLSFLGSAFSYVGGFLDKGDKPDVTLNLDFGSIGIRGTKIYRAMKNGECWIYVERGKVDVKNKGGSVSLKSGQGTIMSAKEKAPAAPHIWSDKDVAWLKSQVADPRLQKKNWK